MYNATMDIEITKNPKRGWSVKTSVYWEGFKNPAVGHKKAGKLAYALWDTIDKNIKVNSIIVNGEPLSLQEAYKIIEKDLKKGSLNWKLPDYKKGLGM